MKVKLTPCPACARHVKDIDRTCPFCGAECSLPVAAARIDRPRMSRAALFAVGAVGAALGSTECSSSTPPSGGSSDASASPDGVGGDGQTASSDAEDAPSAVALYGAFAPPSDAATGTDAALGPDAAAGSDAAGGDAGLASPGDANTLDAPSAVALYGAFAPPDASALPDAGHIAVPLYGAFMAPHDGGPEDGSTTG
jgi:hypothetical protein